MKGQGEKLRRELDQIGTRRGRCVPAELKQRASAWISRRRAEGSTVSELASELGIAVGTVLRWSGDVSRRGIVPVEIVPDAVVSKGVCVVSPSGFRIEGVTLAEAALLLRELG